MSLQPAAAAIAGFVILNQHLGPTPIAALILVSAAGIGITRPPAHAPPEQKVVAQRCIRESDRRLGYHSGSRPAPRNPKG